MTERDRPGSGFHSGELAVQQRAGVQLQAARLRGMVEPTQLSAGVVAFLATRTFAVITARGTDGRLWTSAVRGEPGFLRPTSLHSFTIDAALTHGDPLQAMESDQPIGMIVIEFGLRRRLRINGTVNRDGDGRLSVDVTQAYGNCPQYINKDLTVPTSHSALDDVDLHRDTTLGPDDVELIRNADTFFLGTTHFDDSRDASHRGGPAGFVRVDGNELWWPDFPGNNMFNSFGNVAVDPTSALLFADFETGRTVQLSGSTVVEWDTDVPLDGDGTTGRRARFTIERVVSGHALGSTHGS